MDTRTEHAVAAVRIGFHSGGTLSAFRIELAPGAAGSECDSGSLSGGTRLSAVSSCNDGGIAALQLQPRNLFITANRESLPGADRFHDAERDATSGFSNDQLVSLAASGGVERPVWASAEIVPKSGSG